MFREAWEASADGLAFFDTDGRVRAFDRKFAQLAAGPVTDAGIELLFPAGCRPLDLLAAAKPAATRFCELTSGEGRRLPVRCECVKVEGGLLTAIRLGGDPRNAWMNAILDATDTVIVVLDREGRFVRFNRAAEALTGYSAEEAIGQDAFTLVLFDEDRDALRSAVAQFMARPQGVLRRENRWRMRDGSARLLSWCNTVTRDRAGNAEYLISTATDVTGLRDTENARDSLAGEFLEAQSTGRRDVSRYLHDTISQNLVVLAMSLGNLQREPDNDTAADVEHALRLVDRCCRDLRVIGYALTPPSLDDGGAASALEWYSRRLLEDARVDVEFVAESIPSDTAPEVRALLRAVIQEWAEKAIRYPGAGKTWIVLKSVVPESAMPADATPEVRIEFQSGQLDNEAVHSILASAVIRERVRTLGGRCEAIWEQSGISARISVNAAGVRA